MKINLHSIKLSIKFPEFNLKEKDKEIYNIHKGTIISNIIIKKYIDFKNMLYIGDGETDVPCMKMVMSQGGHAIAVYNPDSKEIKEKRNKNGEIIKVGKLSSKQVALDLFSHGRVNFIAPTNYEENSKLEQIVKNIIDKIYLEQSDV